MKDRTFLNLSEGLIGLFSGNANNKAEILNELFFTTHGRLNRKSYIFRSILIGILTTIIFIFLTIYDYAAASYLGKVLFTTVFLTLVIFLLISNNSLTVRRLHDISASGYWAIIWIIPQLIGYVMILSGDIYMLALGYISGISSLYTIFYFVDFIMWIILLFLRGKEGDNAYGPDPLANCK